MHRLINPIFAVVLLAACAGGSTDPKVVEVAAITETQLTTGANANVQQVWYFASILASYRSAAGNVDSAKYIWNGNSNSELRFSGPPVAQERVVGLNGSDTLKKILPNLGTWLLSDDGRSLVIAKRSATDAGGAGGTWKVTYTATPASPYSSASLVLYTSEALSSGRTLRRELNLYARPFGTATK